MFDPFKVVELAELNKTGTAQVAVTIAATKKEEEELAGHSAEGEGELEQLKPN